MKLLAFILFALTIPLANWMIGHVGTTCIPNGPCLIPVGFGLMAPSGVLMIGIALVLRDWLQDVAGVKMSIVAVLLGGLLSFMTSTPSIAIASGVAFVLAELADLVVYTPLRLRHKPLAVFLSQVVGAVIDSIIFVYLAFGSVELSAGTALGKIYAGIAVSLFLYLKKSETQKA